MAVYGEESVCRRCGRSIQFAKASPDDVEPYGMWFDWSGTESCTPDLNDGDMYHHPAIPLPDPPTREAVEAWLTREDTPDDR